MQEVYALWFKSKNGTYLFGLYTSPALAVEAKGRYESSGMCGLDAGYFQPMELITLNKDLADGYLEK